MDVDVSKPIENPKLTELLKQLAERREARDEQGFRNVMNQAAEEICMNAHFLALVRFSEQPKNNGDGTATFEKNTTIGFVMLNDGEGAAWHPAFTDWNELYKWQSAVSGEQPPQTLILGFDDFAGMIEKNTGVRGLVINPFSDNLMLSRETLAGWAETKKQVLSAPKTEAHIVRGGVDILKKETKVRIGDSEEFPQEISDKLKEHAQGEPLIKRMWLRQIQFDGKQPQYCLIVEHTGEDQPLFDALGGAVNRLLKDMQMCVVSADSELGKKARSGTKPFFKRGLFG